MADRMSSKLDAAKRAARRAEKATADRDQAIAAAADVGNSYRRIADAIGLSYQRVHQIAKAAREPKGTD